MYPQMYPLIMLHKRMSSRISNHWQTSSIGPSSYVCREKQSWETGVYEQHTVVQFLSYPFFFPILINHVLTVSIRTP